MTGNEDGRTDTRLIERWLPIAALGEESVRERRSMTAFPPTYYLHVWWARRPLVASRAAILASLLPANADRERFLHVLGIHGDPVDGAKNELLLQIAKASAWARAHTAIPGAFGYTPSISEERLARGKLGEWGPIGSSIRQQGGGSVPFEVAPSGACDARQ